MGDFTLREYLPTDHDAVCRLHVLGLQQTGVYLGKPSMLDKDLNHIEQVYLATRGTFVVVTAGDTLVGMGALRPQSETVAEIKRMRVHLDYQHRGIGSMILAHLIQKAKSSGYQKIVLDTTPQQHAAQALYRKAGFIETGRRQDAHFERIFYELLLS